MCYSGFRENADINTMQYLDWSEPWFRRAFPPLLVLLAAVLVLWAVIALSTPSGATDTSVSVTPAAPSRGTTQPTLAPPPAAPIQVFDARGVVGKARLGMTLEQVRVALGERLVTVQASIGTGDRFTVVASRAGLTLAGAGSTIDTITITNVGQGKLYRTARGIRIGDASRAVPRRYIGARRICGREWWVQRASNTLRISAQPKVTSITLTTRKAPQYVDCF